jgi:FkbM family methyltransferase
MGQPSALEALNKPYYLFRPGQVVRRALLPVRQRLRRDEYDEVRLPWGLPLRFRANEKTGLCYARRGVFDLPVCEALWRLADPGELALDVGANIGQMTSALAARVGAGGRVIAFEPHPELFEHLAENASRWNAVDGTGEIELRNLGASSSAGVAQLGMDASFDWNRGTASMRRNGEGFVDALEVPVRPLDDEVRGAPIGVMKLDVEGYELEVLRGAKVLLGRKLIRDIVFEDLGEQPTPVTALLEGFGYTVFSLDQAPLGPAVAPVAARAARRSGDDPSYLATADPERALARLRRRGWGVLGLGPYRRRRAAA